MAGVVTGGLVGPDGFGRLDVRAQVETDDGAFIEYRVYRVT